MIRQKRLYALRQIETQRTTRLLGGSLVTAGENKLTEYSRKRRENTPLGIDAMWSFR